jgi:YfiH family protein
MNLHTFGDIQFYSYKLFDTHRNVTNVVSTRVGGASREPYAALNMGFHVGDDADAVLENRAKLSQALGIEPEQLTIAEQVHGSGVAVVKASDRGKGAITDDDAIPGVDAMVTDAPDIPLVALIADCVALSFYDPRHNVIALAHAGWKGTLARIAERTLGCMTESFGCDAADVLVGISPSIGRGHYEVGEDVFKAYIDAFGRQTALQFVQEDMDGTCYLDLWAANEIQLRGAGMAADHIAASEMCTACHLEHFYSHRHEGGRTGRAAAVILRHTGVGRAY